METFPDAVETQEKRTWMVAGEVSVGTTNNFHGPVVTNLFVLYDISSIGGNTYLSPHALKRTTFEFISH